MPAATSTLIRFPLWTIIGGRDELVRPDNTRAFARAVSDEGGTARVTEIADAGHDVWQSAFAHRPLWEWLFAQRAEDGH